MQQTRRLPTVKDGLRADASIWDDMHGCQYLASTFTIHITFSPFGLKTIGFPVVLQTLCRIVVLPALAWPITRMRNWVNFACIFSICSVLNWGFEFEVDIARLIWWYVNDSKWGVTVIVTCDTWDWGRRNGQVETQHRQLTNFRTRQSIHSSRQR